WQRPPGRPQVGQVSERVPNRAQRANWERRRKRASRVALFFITDDIDYAFPPNPARRQAQNEAFAHFSARTCLENTALPPSFLHRKVVNDLVLSVSDRGETRLTASRSG